MTRFEAQIRNSSQMDSRPKIKTNTVARTKLGVYNHNLAKCLVGFHCLSNSMVSMTSFSTILSVIYTSESLKRCVGNYQLEELENLRCTGIGTNPPNNYDFPKKSYDFPRKKNYDFPKKAMIFRKKTMIFRKKL